MACQRNGVQALCGRYGRRAMREMTRERCQWDSKRYRPGLPHPRRPWSRDRCPFTHQAKHFERAPEIEAAALRGESPAIYARDGLWARALPGLYAIQGSPPAPANLGLHVQRGGRRAAGIHCGKSMHAFFYCADQHNTCRIYCCKIRNSLSEACLLGL